jgi:hypothetical protein
MQLELCARLKDFEDVIDMLLALRVDEDEAVDYDEYRQHRFEDDQIPKIPKSRLSLNV